MIYTRNKIPAANFSKRKNNVQSANVFDVYFFAHQDAIYGGLLSYTLEAKSYVTFITCNL